MFKKQKFWCKKWSIFDTPAKLRPVPSRKIPSHPAKYRPVQQNPVPSQKYRPAKSRPFYIPAFNNYTLLYTLKHKISHLIFFKFRYKSEFIELSRLGQGEFGSVYKAVNRFDGCIYAIKKTKKTLKGLNEESASIREVCAHAVLGKHKHVVKYYSAWCEQDRMLIQSGKFMDQVFFTNLLFFSIFLLGK